MDHKFFSLGYDQIRDARCSILDNLIIRQLRGRDIFDGEMPGCCLPPATALCFTAGYLKGSRQQEPTPCFAFFGGNSPLRLRNSGAIILSGKNTAVLQVSISGSLN